MGRLWLELALMDIRLKVLPHALNRRLLFDGSNTATLTPAPQTAKRICRLVRLVSFAAGLPCGFNMSCLRRSLVLRSRLCGLDVPSRLVYGLKRDPGKIGLGAHAWLEAGALRIDISTKTGSGAQDWIDHFSSFSPANRGMPKSSTN